MRSAWSLLLLLAACSESPTTVPPPTGRDATTTSSIADASTGSDANAGDAMSNPNADASATSDSGAMGPGDAPATASDGGMVVLGPVCTELELCCPTLPVLQQQCIDAAAMGDETACQGRLDMARGAGLCLDPTADAGPPAGDAGPLTPECEALAPCCPLAGMLMGICDRLVGNNDPMRCQQTLDLLAGRGIMCTPMMTDAGTSTIGADN